MSNLFTNVIMKRFDFYVTLHFIDERVGTLELRDCTTLHLVQVLQTLSIVHGISAFGVNCSAFRKPRVYEVRSLYYEGFDFTDLTSLN